MSTHGPTFAWNRPVPVLAVLFLALLAWAPAAGASPGGDATQGGIVSATAGGPRTIDVSWVSLIPASDYYVVLSPRTPARFGLRMARIAHVGTPFPTNSGSITFGSLACETEYVVFVLRVNSFGLGFVGGDVTRTGPCPGQNRPCQGRTGIRFTDRTRTSMVMRFNTPCDWQRFRVCLKPGNVFGTPCGFRSFEVSFNTPVTTGAIPITGLFPGTTYFFQLYGINSQGGEVLLQNAYNQTQR